MRTVIGLGNPGKKYENTRHNAGRMAAEYFATKNDFQEFSFDKKSNSLFSKGKIGKDPAIVVLPEAFMNKSGNAVGKFVKPKKEMKDLIVIHDDLDLPLGRFKISYGKSSGGHKGIESVMRALKTKNFVRIRIGISPKKKPAQKDIIKFIIGKFKPTELKIFKKIQKKIAVALGTAVSDSLERAMSEFNG